jgi:phage terminase large subunit GpA-like protein
VVVSFFSSAELLILRAAERAFRPRKRVVLSAWSDAHRVLSRAGSAEPGRWRTSRVPFTREIQDCLSRHSPHRKVVFMKSGQTAGTEIGCNWVGYCVVECKDGSIAVIMPTDDALQEWQVQKFSPMVKDTLPLRRAIVSSRATANNRKFKEFEGGVLFFKSAGSVNDLSSSTLTYVMADEVDRYEWSTAQGNPLSLIEQRMSAVPRSKLYLVSTPWLKDASHIEEQFLGGDQRRYKVPCPHCGHSFHLQWKGLQWTAPPQGRTHVDRAWYVCGECACEIEEHHKGDMLIAGRWVAENEGAPYPSFHINALYTPAGLGLNWAQLATLWIDAQSDPAKLMAFVNLKLGEPWADRSKDIKPAALEARAETVPRRAVPPGCLLLTAGVDVQEDRLELQILGWGLRDRALRCWVVEYHVLPGRPAEQPVWDALAEFLKTPLHNAWGKAMLPEATAIDTGHHTQAVYAFVRARRVRRCIAIKGANVPGKALLGKPSLQDVNWRGQIEKKGVALYTVGTDTAKFTLYSWLDGDADRAADERLVRFPQGLEDTYYAGLVSETFNPRKNRWEIKKGRRNEPLDTWGYAYAATHHPELFMHRWRAGDWARLKRQFEPEDVAPVATDQEPIAVAPAPRQPPAAKAVRTRKRGVFAGGAGWGRA